MATLTGACVVALGKVTTGLFGTPPAWIASVREAAARAGEPVWELPLGPEYREILKSEIADIVNSGGRAGGAITAAMFLKEFAGTTPWAHLDIAGTAWIDDAKPWAPKGASGVMVRTLVELRRRRPSVESWTCSPPRSPTRSRSRRSSAPASSSRRRRSA